MHRPITPELIVNLRDLTGAPLAACKQALEKHDGSIYRAYHQLLSNHSEALATLRQPPPPSQVDKHFPRCRVQGSYTPTDFGHLGLDGAVPENCSTCEYLFEGECLRVPLTYMALDHGPCGVEGSPDPVRVAEPAEDLVPAKCSTCEHLAFDRIRSYHCKSAQEAWGDFPRGLDWGERESP